jgi:hypothetical protein
MLVVRIFDKYEEIQRAKQDFRSFFPNVSIDVSMQVDCYKNSGVSVEQFIMSNSIPFQHNAIWIADLKEHPEFRNAKHYDQHFDDIDRFVVELNEEDENVSVKFKICVNVSNVEDDPAEDEFVENEFVEDEPAEDEPIEE